VTADSRSRALYEYNRQRSSAERTADDFYPTPSPATRGMLVREELPGVVWEPACGDGAIARVLTEAGITVHASDLMDRGYGMAGIDFITYQPEVAIDCIVTNPPFKLARAFVQRALEIAQRKVIMIMKLDHLRGIQSATYLQSTPLRRVWVLTRPLPFLRDGVWSQGLFSHAWYIWEQGYEGSPELGWISPEELVEMRKLVGKRWGDAT
jgi:hypothetical protein